MLADAFLLSIQQQRILDAYAGAPLPRSEIAIRIPSNFDLASIDQRLEASFKKHEILRTRFERVPELTYPLQVIEDKSTIFWNVDYTGTFGAVLTISVPVLCCDHSTLMMLASHALGMESSEPGADVLQYADFAGWQNTLPTTEGESPYGRLESSHASSYVQPSLTRLYFQAETVQKGDSYRFWRHDMEHEIVERLETIATSWRVPVSSLLLALWVEQVALLAAEEKSVGVTLGRHGNYEGAFGPYASCYRMSWVVKEGQDTRSLATQISDELTTVSQMLALNPYFGDSQIAFPVQFEYVGPMVESPVVLRVQHFPEPFRIKLNIRPSAESLCLDFWFDESMFTVRQLQRIAEQYEKLYQDLLLCPARVITGSLPLGRTELDLLLKQWSGSPSRELEYLTFPKKVEQQTRKSPDQPAIACGNQSLSYRELNNRSNQIAHLLRQMGTAIEDRVILYLERNIDSVVCFLAVLKAGAVYVPIEPAYTQGARLTRILKDCQPAVIITQSALMSRLDGSEAEIICLDRDRSRIACQPVSSVDVSLAPESLAYIIYTSGTTGAPKGVMVQHRSLMNLGYALFEAIYQQTSGRVASIIAPLSFDASVKQLVLLGFGFALRLISDVERENISLLVKRIVESRVSVVDATPAMVELLADEGLWGNDWAPEIVLVGGEAISDHLWIRLTELQRTAFYNVYGPTECTVDATFARVDGSLPTIGRPLPNIGAYVLNQNLELVPAGCPGELFVAGGGVARGYWREPSITADRFRPDPFSAQAGRRLYRTGDLARYREDGSLAFMGRSDNQVKIRGFRIELGAIESALYCHKAIRKAVVRLIRDEYGEDSLTAFYQSSETLSADQLRSDLLPLLPAYMIPEFFYRVDTIPTTENCKIDTDALIASIRRQKCNDTQPETDTEAALMEIWRDLLHRDSIDRKESFFEVGGHSLTAMQLMSRIRRIFDLNLPLAQIFEKPTIEELARTIDDTLQSTRPPVAHTIVIEQLTYASPS